MTTVITPFRFDATAVVKPISAAAPAGESLRYDPLYDVIAGLRKEDDPTLEQGVWKSELKRADWPAVAQVCVEALEGRSKDLQIAAWLLEAWIHLHGFSGLREGIRLIATLCDTYWEGLHPEIVDGDIDYRLAPIQWIDDKLTIAVKLVPMTQPEADDLPPCSLADWETASAPQPKQRTRDDGRITQARFAQSATMTRTEWLFQTREEVRDALGAADDLRAQLERHCGNQAPALATLRDALRTILALLSTALDGREDLLAPDRGVDLQVRAPRLEDVVVEEMLPVENGFAAGGPIRTRGEAYQRLAEAADFLARTEPHSPVPHLVRRAITWGSLSLEELLPELVRDGKQLEEIYRTLQLGSRLQP